MNVTLRTPAESDWPVILDCANAALPGAPDGNRGWLDARRRFDETEFSRRHYVAEDERGVVVAYAGIEGDPDAARYRLFLVTAPDRLDDGLGDVLLGRLLRDLDDVGAAVAWMREEADDTAFLAFLRFRGFVETARFAPAGDAGAYAGIELVVVELRAGEGGFRASRAAGRPVPNT